MPSLARRHHVTVTGEGRHTLLFVHGLGCDQTMWRHVAPAFADRARLVLMDLAGFGRSDHAAWDAQRHGTLEGHALDVVEVAQHYAVGRTVVVGHSVGAMIGLLADLHAPALFDAHAMVAPSPCYSNEPGYAGGFDASTLHATLDLLDQDIAAWTGAMLPLLLPQGDAPGPGGELAAAFCRSRPEALRTLARTTFLGDCRVQARQLAKPALVIQGDQDLVAPACVGRWLGEHMRDCTVREIADRGHCPHVTRPDACIALIAQFLDSLQLAPAPAA